MRPEFFAGVAPAGIAAPEAAKPNSSIKLIFSGSPTPQFLEFSPKPAFIPNPAPLHSPAAKPPLEGQAFAPAQPNAGSHSPKTLRLGFNPGP
nr:hypothetical protein Itr_chr12CG29600 [Ipomoea trifida]